MSLLLLFQGGSSDAVAATPIGPSIPAHQEATLVFRPDYNVTDYLLDHNGDPLLDHNGQPLIGQIEGVTRRGRGIRFEDDDLSV